MKARAQEAKDPGSSDLGTGRAGPGGPRGLKPAARQSRLRPFLIGLGTVVLACVVTAAIVLWPEQHTYFTDADTINEPARTARVRDILWQPAIRLPDQINTAGEAYEPRLSADGMTLFFVRGKAGQNADIYHCRRTADGWTDPKPLDEVNTADDELGPEPSADGTSLYFYSDRPGGLGGYDLWMVSRWQGQPPGGATATRPLEAMNLGSKVNSEFNDYGPALSRDGKSLYFASNRPRPTDARQLDADAWPGTIREDLYHRTYDLYEAPITETSSTQGLGEARAIDALNTPYNEGAPAITPYQDFIYFASDRPGGEGGFDLYRSRRLRGNYQPPATLGAIVNTAANELDPGLTLGGYALYFSSDRPAKRVDPDAPNPYHVYQTTSREVFTETETRRAEIDWAALWSKVGPNLLWALLALIAFLLFLALLGDLKRRKLGLLARCLIASVAAHALLIMLFHGWQVSAILAQALKGRGPIRIALLAPARGDDIASQIRGGFISAEPVAPSEIKAERWQAAMELEQPASMAVLTVQRGPIEIESRTDIRLQTSDARTHRSVKLPTHKPREVEEAAGLVLKLPLPVQTAPTRDSGEPPTRTAKPLVGLASEPPPLGSGSREPPGSVPAVVMPPESSLAATPRPMGKSLAAKPTKPDATVLRGGNGEPRASARAALENPVKLAPAGPDAMNLSLPRIGPRREGSEESDAALAITAHAALAQHRPEPPRRDLLGESPPANPAPPIRELAPTRRTLYGDGTSLARSSLPRETRGRTASTLSPSRDAELASPGLPPGALSLPLLEESTLALVERTYSRPDPAKIREVPRLAGPLPATEGGDAPPAIDILPPRRISREVDPVSLSRSSRNPRDAAALLPRLPASPPRTGVSFVPQASALGLRLPADVIGAIRGVVTDASTDQPLSVATVRLDLPDRAPVEVTTDHNGRYELLPPEVPTFFALSAASEGYLPVSKNVARASVQETTLVLNFELNRETPAVVAVETSPEVHHLGDDDFGGRINSQFQKRSEGSSFSATFTLAPTQIPRHAGDAAVTLLVKGVQLRHRIVINGQVLGAFLDRAPRDGSFGAFVVPFDPALLKAGANTIRIIASSRGRDVDDFEFVNLQIRLRRQSIM